MKAPYYLKHGQLTAHPTVSKLDGNEVEWVDGQRETFDLGVCATGYHVADPFLPTEPQRVESSTVQ